MFREVGEFVEQTMDAKERTKMYVVSVTVYALALAGLFAIIRKIIRRK